ncbi:MAG: aldo/keto reductase [Bacteroidales bacterium]|jgi:diketogulonate reductase-like aldo/keto reductase|nr:aldo/keto reductase [Bacteroidales bacterium]
MKNTGFFTLANGVNIPAIGFGTWQIPSGDVAYNSVREAIKAGYRHIDTAQAYGNEASVGKAILDSGIDRSEIFVTSKLPAEIKSYEQAVRRAEFTMKKIGLGYIDLYLIHAPWPWSEIGADYARENIEVWKAMEEFCESGKTRSIGISNFNVRDTEAILETCRIRPTVNQIKLHIGHPQEEITAFCRRNNILVEGYSPLATGRILGNGEIARIAGKYGKTVAQVSVRYVLQKGALPLPKSVHPEYIKQNFDVNFEISGEDMVRLDSLK